ncbi:MAG TPA: DUF4388 domain-containing protein [Planctomycetota bacterium]|jgi:hypothetical protein
MADPVSTPTVAPRGVLLVCYNAETLGALVAILQKAGETAMAPTSILDAWECIRTDTVGCVVLDLTGPSSEVMALFRVARSCSKARAVPFLFLIDGGNVIPKFERYGVEMLSDDWLVLPSPADDFLNKVRGLLAVRAAQVGPQFGARRQGAAPTVQPVVQPEELLRVPGAVFSGMLGVLDVTRILSMLEPLKLTGVLDLTDGKRFGQIFFINGAVYHAELQDIQGADALFLLFHLKSGSFRFEISAPTQKRTIVGNTMALLLEGLRQMDEAKAIIKSFHDKRAPQAASESGTAPATGTPPAAQNRG